jgi:hypothetical protein
MTIFLCLSFLGSLAISSVPIQHGSPQHPSGFVVEFADSTSPKIAGARLEEFQKAGLKDVRVLTSPIAGGHRVYRVVSRSFSTLREANLALLEAKSVLRQEKLAFKGIVLREAEAGTPLIR